MKLWEITLFVENEKAKEGDGGGERRTREIKARLKATGNEPLFDGSWNEILEREERKIEKGSFIKFDRWI